MLSKCPATRVDEDEALNAQDEKDKSRVNKPLFAGLGETQKPR